MFVCTKCGGKKMVLSTMPEYEFRRMRQQHCERSIEGVSDYCSVCKALTFFFKVDHVEDEGPLVYQQKLCALEAVAKIQMDKDKELEQEQQKEKTSSKPGKWAEIAVDLPLCGLRAVPTPPRMPLHGFLPKAEKTKDQKGRQRSQTLQRRDRHPQVTSSQTRSQSMDRPTLKEDVVQKSPSQSMQKQDEDPKAKQAHEGTLDDRKIPARERKSEKVGHAVQESKKVKNWVQEEVQHWEQKQQKREKARLAKGVTKLDALQPAKQMERREDPSNSLNEEQTAKPMVKNAPKRETLEENDHPEQKLETKDARQRVRRNEPKQAEPHPVNYKNNAPKRSMPEEVEHPEQELEIKMEARREPELKQAKDEHYKNLPAKGKAWGNLEQLEKDFQKLVANEEAKKTKQRVRRQEELKQEQADFRKNIPRARMQEEVAHTEEDLEEEKPFRQRLPRNEDPSNSLEQDLEYEHWVSHYRKSIPKPPTPEEVDHPEQKLEKREDVVLAKGVPKLGAFQPAKQSKKLEDPSNSLEQEQVDKQWVTHYRRNLSRSSTSEEVEPTEQKLEKREEVILVKGVSKLDAFQPRLEDPNNSLDPEQGEEHWFTDCRIRVPRKRIPEEVGHPEQELQKREEVMLAKGVTKLGILRPAKQLERREDPSNSLHPKQTDKPMVTHYRKSVPKRGMPEEIEHPEQELEMRKIALALETKDKRRRERRNEDATNSQKAPAKVRTREEKVEHLEQELKKRKAVTILEAIQPGRWTRLDEEPFILVDEHDLRKPTKYLKVSSKAKEREELGQLVKELTKAEEATRAKGVTKMGQSRAHKSYATENFAMPGTSKQSKKRHTGGKEQKYVLIQPRSERSSSPSNSDGSPVVPARKVQQKFEENKEMVSQLDKIQLRISEECDRVMAELLEMEQRKLKKDSKHRERGGAHITLAPTKDSDVTTIKGSKKKSALQPLEETLGTLRKTVQEETGPRYPGMYQPSAPPADSSSSEQESTSEEVTDVATSPRTDSLDFISPESIYAPSWYKRPPEGGFHSEYFNQVPKMGYALSSVQRAHYKGFACDPRKAAKLLKQFNVENTFTAKPSMDPPVAQYATIPCTRYEYCFLRDTKAYMLETSAPRQLNVSRLPINCPDVDCQRLSFISDFNLHLLHDHRSLTMERMKMRQAKTFFLDPSVTVLNKAKCHMLYLVKDKIIDSTNRELGDLLPVLVMTARVRMSEVFGFTEAIQKYGATTRTLDSDLYLIWLCSFKPNDMNIVGTIGVWSTLESQLIESLFVHTSEVYDIRAPQDINSICRSSCTVILPGNLVNRMTNNGKSFLAIQVQIY